MKLGMANGRASFVTAFVINADRRRSGLIQYSKYGRGFFGRNLPKKGAAAGKKTRKESERPQLLNLVKRLVKAQALGRQSLTCQ